MHMFGSSPNRVSPWLSAHLPMLPTTLGQTAKPVSVLSFLGRVIDACKRWCSKLRRRRSLFFVWMRHPVRARTGTNTQIRVPAWMRACADARAVVGARRADRSVQLTIFSRCSFRHFSSRRASGRDPARKRQAFWLRIPLLPQGSGMLICSEKVGVEGRAVTSALANPAVSLPTQLLGGLLLLSCP